MLPGCRIASRNASAGLGDVRPHAARRESGATAPAAEHSAARRASTLGFRVFP